MNQTREKLRSLNLHLTKKIKLKQHVRNHTKEKPYNCELWQCKFRFKCHIHCHKRRKHWHEKMFCCNVQGKSCVENEELTRQLLTQKEVRHKTMKCDICDYSTDGITNLTHHKKIHYTPEKTFDCTKSGKEFRNKFFLHQQYQTPKKKK